MGTAIGFITTAEKEEAQKIANALLEKRLIACANIVKEISSSYWWKGKIENAKEALLIVKTRAESTKQVIEEVKKLHSYEVPCIEFIEVKSGNKDYEKWVEEETK